MKERLTSLVWRGALFHACHRQVAQSSQGFDKKQRHLSRDSEAGMKGLFTKGDPECRNMSRPTEAVGLGWSWRCPTSGLRTRGGKASPERSACWNRLPQNCRGNGRNAQGVSLHAPASCCCSHWLNVTRNRRTRRPGWHGLKESVPRRQAGLAPWAWGLWRHRAPPLAGPFSALAISLFYISEQGSHISDPKMCM